MESYKPRMRVVLAEQNAGTYLFAAFYIDATYAGDVTGKDRMRFHNRENAGNML